MRQTRSPGRGVAKFRCAGYARRMAGGALAVVDGFTAAQRTVGVADLDMPHLLQALGLGHFRVGRARSGLVLGGDEGHQPDDDQDRNHKREKDGEQKLLGVSDRACMCFFVGGGTHDVLNVFRGIDQQGIIWGTSHLAAARFPVRVHYGNVAAWDMIWRKKKGHDPEVMAFAAAGMAAGAGGFQRCVAGACAVLASGVTEVTPPPSALYSSN